MFVVISTASVPVTSAQTRPGSSLRTTGSVSPSVTQATSGWVRNSAPS